jgi:hypothetical protein
MRWIRSTRKGTNRELRREERKKWTGWPECETGNSRPARGDERGRRRSRGEKGRPKMTIEQHTIEPKRLRKAGIPGKRERTAQNHTQTPEMYNAEQPNKVS